MQRHLAKPRTFALLYCLLAVAPAGAETDELDALFGAHEPETRAATTELTPPGEAAANGESPKVIELPARPAPQPAAASPSGRVIEEIIVTAQKREQRLQDVPVSVSTFTDAFIEELGIVDIGELVQYTPNVKFNDALGYAPVMTIRGFGTPPLGRGLEPSVGLAIDEVFYGRSTYINDSNFDTQRVEVLRGPQGTLFGKNTIAGVVNFTTREPDFEGSGYLSAGTAPYNEYKLEAARSVTLIEDVLAARVALRYRDRDSHLYNTAREEQNFTEDLAGRIKLKWFINDRSELLLNAWQSRQQSLGLPIQLMRASEKSLAVFRDHDPQADGDAFNGTTSMDNNTFSHRDTRSVNFKYRAEVPALGRAAGWDLALIGGWSEMFSPYALDGDFSPIDFIRFGTDTPDFYKQINLELRLNGDLGLPFGWGESLHFISGIFASQSRHGVSTVQFGGADAAEYARAGAFFDPAPSLIIPFGVVFPLEEGEFRETIFNSTRARSKGIAYFTQLDWALSESLALIFGLRYGEDSRRGRISAGRSQTTVAATVVAGQEDFDETIDGSDYDFTPKLTMTWEPFEELTLFATVTRGFKSGGFAAAVFNNDNLTFEPERARAYELGFKSRFLNGSLMLNGAAFHSRYTDLQVRNFDGRTIYVENAADAKTTGFELDFFWLPPIANLSIGGSAGLVEARYIEYLCAPAVAGTAPGTGDDSCFDDTNVGIPPAFQDLSGKPLSFAPEVSASLYSQFHWSIRNTMELVLGLDLLHQGAHFIDTDNDPIAHQPATNKLNARVGVRDPAGSWSALLNLKNLGGEEESALVLDQPSIAGNYVSAAFPSEPIWQLDLRYEF